ncbi:MAG: DUF4115 domain-containing protein [Alphaproteobacteria bacterium]|nr:DUF4115 domain-containing protein [Alphaproteobacteria bacterium]
MKKEEILNIKEPKEAIETLDAKTEENVSPKVGDVISQKRQFQKMDILEVADKLRIRKIYLEAIENNDYETLPAFPYGVGFVRSYADFLGLDGAALADEYKKETNLKEKTNLRVIDNGDIVNDSTIPSQAYLVLSVVAVLLIYFGWVFVNKYYNILPQEVVENEAIEQDSLLDTDDVEVQPEVQVIDMTNQTVIEDSQIIVEAGDFVEESLIPFAETPATVEAPVEEEKGAQEAEKTPLTGEGVEILMTNETWFEAKDGNKLFVSKEFKKGDYYKVPNFPNMIVSIGRPNAAEVYVNGKLTPVFTAYKKMNVSLDKFLETAEH